jgi:hypothetical protein
MRWVNEYSMRISLADRPLGNLATCIINPAENHYRFFGVSRQVWEDARAYDRVGLHEHGDIYLVSVSISKQSTNKKMNLALKLLTELLASHGFRFTATIRHL